MPNVTVNEVYRGEAVRPRSIQRHPLVVGTNLVGVEIELENITRVTHRFDYWSVKSDGSLRNGLEFVFRGPTGGLDLFNAVVELDSYLFDKNPDDSWRCSTHVHVDARDMNLAQLKNLILIWVVYEKLMFRLSGMHRYTNNFCCAIGFAQQQLDVLSNNWNKDTTRSFLTGVLRQWDKYSAMNLIPLTSFGSVEFRISEATWKKGKLLMLCNRLLSMKELAMDWAGSQRELIDHLLNANPYRVLAKGCPKEMPTEWRDDVETGFKLASDLLTFSANGPVVELGFAWPEHEIVGAINAGELPQGLVRLGPDDIATQTPMVTSISNPVYNYLVSNCRANGYFFPEQLRHRLNFGAILYFADLFDIRGPAFMDPSYHQAYEAWINGGYQRVPIRDQQEAIRATLERLRGQSGSFGYDGGAPIQFTSNSTTSVRFDELFQSRPPEPEEVEDFDDDEEMEDDDDSGGW